MVERISIQELAREISARMDPSSLLDAEDVASMLKCSTRYVLEHFAPDPQFPKPIRLKGARGGRGHPRWLRSDITQWIDSHRNVKTTGRPRNRV